MVEAVYEDLPLKQQVFADLDRHCPPPGVLASNTSSFMTSQLASSTRNPGRVVVGNWWNPPYLVPLVEVVRGPQTSDGTIASLRRLLEAAGKRPIVLQKESLGFIGNRMQFALLREALAIVDQGIATPEDVDDVVRTSFGRRLAVAGPLEVFDFAGWDTISHIIDELFPDLDTSPGEFHRAQGDGCPGRVRGEIREGVLRVGRGEGRGPEAPPGPRPFQHRPVPGMIRRPPTGAGT